MNNFKKFHDRQDAGIQLANALLEYQHDPDAIVLAIPRGGVPVAYEIAQKLQLPLDIFIVRKLGVPSQKELAMGALASGDVIFFNDDVLSGLHLSQKEIDRVIEAEKTELKRRELKYRQNHPFSDIKNKKIILVDDGIATGASIHAAIIALKKLNPKKIIIAVPVAPNETIHELSLLVDAILCLYPAPVFSGVGEFYDDFSQTSDAEVIYYLKSMNML